MRANETDPSHIYHLLVQCCTWSKPHHPRVVDILNRLETVGGKVILSDENIDQMSIDIPISNDSLYFDENHTKDHKILNFTTDENVKVQSMQSSHDEEFNSNFKIESCIGWSLKTRHVCHES